jgi:hypothetical protein
MYSELKVLYVYIYINFNQRFARLEKSVAALYVYLPKNNKVMKEKLSYLSSSNVNSGSAQFIRSPHSFSTGTSPFKSMDLVFSTGLCLPLQLGLLTFSTTK